MHLQLAHLGPSPTRVQGWLIFLATITPDLDAEDPASPRSNFPRRFGSRTTLTSITSRNFVPVYPSALRERCLRTPFCRFTASWSRKLSIRRECSASWNSCTLRMKGRILSSTKLYETVSRLCLLWKLSSRVFKRSCQWSRSCRSRSRWVSLEPVKLLHLLSRRLREENTSVQRGKSPYQLLGD
jgi:hypothetical protein